MTKPFDAVLKTLVDDHAGDWAAFLAPRLGTAVGPAAPVDTDLSESLQADRLLRVDAPGGAYLLHLEFESGHALGRPRRLLRYNVAAMAANDWLPARSVLVLLRPEANSTDLAGRLEAGDITFVYSVVRVWEVSVEALLVAGPGLAPLALLSDEAAGRLSETAPRVVERLRADGASPAELDGLAGMMLIAAGLRYNRGVTDALFRELAMILEESSFAEVLRLHEARRQVRRAILRLGTRRFGPPPAEVVAALEAIDGLDDLDRLDRLMDAVLDASDWADLLARA